MCGDDLVLGRQVRVALVLEVADRTRQVEVAIDAAHAADVTEEATRGLNAVLLYLVRGLMVIRQRHGRPAAAQHRTAVAGVAHENLPVPDHRHDGGAARLDLVLRQLAVLVGVHVARAAARSGRSGRRQGLRRCRVRGASRISRASIAAVLVVHHPLQHQHLLQHLQCVILAHGAVLAVSVHLRFAAAPQALNLRKVCAIAQHLIHAVENCLQRLVIVARVEMALLL
mmetsp:Transcript_5580/g.14189  ORF Transcript_5580/g.14189 Transcript_5580/m.14189 type:complete len:227 (+) Transcript_5580:366-1046(+)